MTGGQVAVVVDEQGHRLQDHDDGPHRGGAVPDDRADRGADQRRKRREQRGGHRHAPRAGVAERDAGLVAPAR